MNTDREKALFNALYALSLKTRETFELSVLLQEIVEQATQLLKGTGGGFYLCDAQRQELRCVVSFQTKRDFRGAILKYGEGVAGIVAQSGKPLIIDDYRSWSKRALQYDTEQPFRAVIGAPVIWQNQVSGVLDVLDDSEKRHFTREDLGLLSLFANQTALIVENSRLLESEQQQQKEAETLRQTAATLTSSLNLNEVLDNMLTLLNQVVNYDSATVFLRAGDHLRAKALRNIPNPENVLRMSFLTDEEGLFKEIFRSRKTIILDDAQKDPRFRNWSETQYIHSWMGIPMILKDEIIGILTCDHHTPGYYTTNIAALAQAFSDQVTIAVENARLFEAERKRVSELEAVRQASISLTASLELTQVLYAILESALHMLPRAGNSHIFLYNAESEQLTFGAALYSDGRRGKPFAQPRPHGLTAKVARTGQLITVENIQENPLYKDAPRDWVGAIVGLPLMIGKRVIGVMNITFSTPQQIPEAELRALQLLGDQAAIAIENARLYEQAATERRHLGLIFDISRELSRSLDPDQILERAITLTCQALGSRVGEAFLYLPEEDRLSLRALYGRRQDSLIKIDTELNIRPGRGLAGWVAHVRQPVNVRNVKQEEHWIKIAGIDNDIAAALCTPVEVEGKLLGVLTVLNQEEDSFGPEHVQLMQAICQEVGLALSNAQRYQQVQRRLKEITLIQDLTLAFNQRLEVRELLDEIVTQLVEKLGYSHIAIFLIEADYLVLKASHGLLILTRAFPISSSIAKRILHHGETSFTPDVSADPEYTAWSDTPILSEIAVPIHQKGVLAGVMLIGSPERNRLTTQDSDLLQVLAGQAAVALENAFLYETVQTHATELETIVAQRTAALSGLYKFSQEIGYSLSFDELIRLLLRHLIDAIECDLAAGCLGDENFQTIKVQVRQPTDEIVLENVRQSWMRMLEEAGESNMDGSQLECEVIQGKDFEPDLTRLEVINSWIWAPITIDQKRIGALGIGSAFHEAFGPAQERLLSTFANQASTAAQRLSMILTAQQKQLESLVENLSIGVLLLDQDFRILVANPASRDILQALGVQDIGKNLLELGPYTLEDIIEKQSQQLPIEISAQDASKRIFAAQIGPAGAPTGETPNQWVLALSDITQERDYMLRAQIQERLATVGQLAAGIAHDFNNIMAAILVYADLLLYDPSISPANQEKLSIIQQQIQRASSLIRQILDFSRRSVMDQSELDMLPLIKELDKMLVRILPETIQIQLSYQPGAYWVNGDPARLQQVFMNLALNARDAMPDGGVLRFELSKIKVISGGARPFPDMENGNWARIAVIDSGIGISPEDRAHIFEPFFTTKPVSQGTGLGLAQVYGIVRQHDGHIDVQSRRGEGASFLIYLPLLEKTVESVRSTEQPGRLTGQGQTIMIVEDDEATRQALQTLLDAIGYHSLVATNGQEALKLFDEHKDTVHLVISDVVMPKMGGIELYQTLKLRYPTLRMLLITGHPLEENNQKLLEKGQVNWLQKPFTVQGLNQAIQNLLISGPETTGPDTKRIF